MKILVKNIEGNPLSLLRRAGYIFQRQEASEMSFVRPLARAGYPRFHAYTKLDERNLLINIHLDQKKQTYGESTRHHGEYEATGPLKEEVTRMLGILGNASAIL